MLNISMDKTHFTVKLDGHAGYAPVGADIVCAGASMLAATLARALGGVAGYHYVDDGNMMEVSCTPTAAQLPRVLTTLDVIDSGFSLLASTYPNHVKYKNIA